MNSTKLATHYLTSDNQTLNIHQLDVLNQWLFSEYTKIPYAVEFVNGTPYDGFENLRDSVHATDILKISTDNNDSQVFPGQLNLIFRAVHDYHHIENGSDFSLVGEWLTFLYACFTIDSFTPTGNHTGSTEEARNLLISVIRSEIVYQAATFFYLGDFPEIQKLVLTTP